MTPGQLLADRFLIVRRIARGGMGVVYEAYDEKLARSIALKCARAGRDRHLYSEVRLATEVSHPNICKIYEIHTAQNNEGPLDFFTMELLEGRTLRQLIQSGALQPKQNLDLGIEIADALEAAHEVRKSSNAITVAEAANLVAEGCTFLTDVNIP